MAINFYKDIADISMRHEFDQLLLGGDTGMPTGTPFLLRLIRYQPGTAIPLPCDCVDPVTREPDRDTPCPKCGGTGFLYDESIIYGWKFDKTSYSIDNEASPIGLLPDGSYVFYFRYKEVLGKIDTIYDIRLDASGNVLTPIERLQEYTLRNVEYIRLDGSKIEFVKIAAKLRDGVNLNTSRYMP